VQYFGNKHFAGSQHYDLLAPLLEITTALDPHLTVAYEFGANFLAPQPPNGAGLPQRAIELSEFGIRNNPNEWRLYYDLGFIYYMELKDYAHAADAFARGSRVPNAHPFLAVMAAQMAQHSGELRMAQMMWATTYQSTQDRNVRANAATHLRALQVEEDVTTLENLVVAYRARTGHLPASFSELQAAGILREIPVDPFGHTYKLTSDGRVEVRTPDDFPFLTKGTPPGYVAPPPKFLPSD
jgi:tetratricopeptide (TPR) repeat protein